MSYVTEYNLHTFVFHYNIQVTQASREFSNKYRNKKITWIRYGLPNKKQKITLNSKTIKWRSMNSALGLSHCWESRTTFQESVENESLHQLLFNWKKLAGFYRYEDDSPEADILRELFKSYTCLASCSVRITKLCPLVFTSLLCENAAACCTLQ